MNTPLRTIRLNETPAPTHLICTPVCALLIYAVDEIDTHRRITAIDDGECVHVQVPADFCHLSTPVTGDWLLISPDGVVSHRRADLFEAESTAIGRGQGDPYRGPFERPRVPRRPYLPS